MALASIYNHHRYARQTLKKFRKAEASFVVQLHDDGWKFAGQEENLSYHGPMRPFLQAIRSQSIPSYLLPPLLAQDPPIPLYDGCIIVEVHDYRLRTGTVTPQQELTRRSTGVDHSIKHRLVASRRLVEQGGPALSAHGLIGVKSDTERKAAKKRANKAAGNDGGGGADGQSLAGGGVAGQFQKYRVVLRPDSETLWEFLCHYNVRNGRAVQGNGDWDDEAMLQLEARILAATAPPLNLGTSILPTRIANVASALTRPTLDSMAFDGQFAGPSRTRQEEEIGDPNGATAAAAESGDGGAINEAEDGGEDGQKPSASAASGPAGSADAGAAPRKVTLLSTEADGKQTDEWLKARGLERQDLDILLGGKEQYEAKVENPFASMQWVRRTLSFLSMRNPGGQIPSDVIITPVNLAGGAGVPPGSAGMRSVDGSVGDNQHQQQQQQSAGAGGVDEKKKPTKKKKKPAAAAAAAASATTASNKSKPDPTDNTDKKPNNSTASGGAKSKNKKKKDDEPPASAAGSGGKKRTAEQMADEQSSVKLENAAATVTPDKKGSATAALGTKKSATKKASKDVPPPPSPSIPTATEPPKKKAKKNTTNKDGAAPASAASAPPQAPQPPPPSAIDFAALASFIPPDAIPPGGGPIPEQAFLAAAQQYGNPNSLGPTSASANPMLGMPVLPLQAQPPPPQAPPPTGGQPQAAAATTMPDLSVLAGSSQEDIAAMVAALSGTAGGGGGPLPNVGAASRQPPPAMGSRAPPGA